jgi:hypothetical protein
MIFITARNVPTSKPKRKCIAGQSSCGGVLKQITHIKLMQFEHGFF